MHGGFHEQLDAARRPLPGPRRLLTQCRQLYVLSHAAVLGERSGAAAAERGYAVLRRTYQDPAHGGWWFRATAGGAPDDRHKDLYAHAFVLFALAWLHRAFAAPDAIPLAETTFAVVAEKLGTPNGGFWDAAEEDWTPRHGLRRQNPHMHLLEALLALHAATGAAHWRDAAAPLVTLCRDRFVDPATGTLGEFFGPDWLPDPERGGIIEPGHHFEWVWLLNRFDAAGGRVDTGDLSDRLFGFARRHGIDPASGAIPDHLDRTGEITLASRRIWPVTEAIKAHAVRGAPVAPVVAHLFRDFLAPAPGGWIERRAADGTPLQTTLPATTPYHLFLAAAEAAPPG